MRVQEIFENVRDRHTVTIMKTWNRRVAQIYKLPQFKRWFSGSKVWNHATGLPEICFHYGQGQFDKFRPFTHFGTPDAAEARFEDKLFFAHSAEEIDSFDYGHTTPVFLSIKKPLFVPDLGGHFIEDYVNELSGNGRRGSRRPIITPEEGDPIVALGEDDPKAWTALAKLILSKGYDGFEYTNTVEDEGGTAWIILKPSQVLPLFQFTGQIPGSV
jgi:hypothetical protein